MAYYTEDEPDVRRRSIAGGWISWGLVGVLALAIGILASTPSDYVIESPGLVFDALGTVEVDGNPVPMIDIPSQQTYPTTGSLNLLTVSISGDREEPATWLEVAQAALDPSRDAVALDVAFPDGQTAEESNLEGAAQMQASQRAAIAAALTATGHDYQSTLVVAATTPGGPSDEVLLEGDVITAVNQKKVDDVAGLRSLIAANGTEQALSLTILREDVPAEVVITPVLNEAEKPEPVIGIEISVDYVFPFEVNIQLSDVGGPSAGQIFALAVIDKITPGSLNGGLSVAATGTVTADGLIGPIGGVTQKLYAADAAGARYFLLPAANCADLVPGAVPKGLDIYAVDSLSDSLYVLNSLAVGAGTSLLPRCPAR